MTANANLLQSWCDGGYRFCILEADSFEALPGFSESEHEPFSMPEFRPARGFTLVELLVETPPGSVFGEEASDKAVDFPAPMPVGTSKYRV